MNEEGFIEKAKRLVTEERKRNGESTPDPYVVWFSKTLQNWKALLSTDVPDNTYYEVTYNGDKRETYVDTYVKELNRVYKD